MPWFGNENYLKNYIDSLENYYDQLNGGRSAGSNIPPITIPVQFIVLLADGEILDIEVPPHVL